MRRPWARRARFLALLVVGAGSIALGVLTWRTSTAGPSRRLVRDIQSRAEAHFLRPSHVANPVPGTFGATAGGPWDALTEPEALSVDVELCRAVRDGEQPFSTASPSCLREMAGASAEVAGLLEATHRSEAGPVPGLGTLDDSPAGARARSWSTLPYAAKLVALRSRAELDTAQAPQALATCVDLLAVARDASWGTGLAGRLPAAGVTEVAFRPCVAAIDATPAEARLSAVEALRRIEAGTPDLAYDPRRVRPRGPGAGLRSVPPLRGSAAGGAGLGTGGGGARRGSALRTAARRHLASHRGDAGRRGGRGPAAGRGAGGPARPAERGREAVPQPRRPLRVPPAGPCGADRCPGALGGPSAPGSPRRRGAPGAPGTLAGRRRSSAPSSAHRPLARWQSSPTAMR